MSSGKRSSYELTTNTTEERPHSFYDNLTATSPASGSRVIQIPDIQFKFDDDIAVTTDPRRSTLMSNAKSDFFGLSKAPPGSPVDAVDFGNNSRVIDQTDELKTLLNDDDRKTPPATILPASSSSPTSTASTAPARSSAGSPDDPESKSRPISAHRNITIRLPETGTPSEAVYMTTTVPQNFSKNSSTLIGRHKPTRSSLRHSRMLVVNNKNYHQRYPKGNSLNLRHIRLSRLLMVLKIVIGAVLAVVGTTIIVWSPNTHTKDNPYWAGLILVLSGSLFLILFDFKRRPANRLRENFYNFIRVNALVVLLLTIFFTMLAFIYALIHTTNLSSSHLRCEPEYRFNVNSSSCVCLIDGRALTEEPPLMVSELRGPASTESDGYFFNDDGEDGDGEGDDRITVTSSSSSTTTTTTYQPPILSGLDLRRAAERLEDEGVIRLEYRDFNCSEVLSIWYYVTLGSTILNSIGCLLAAIFLVIYGIECQRRDNELKYLSVRTNGSKQTEQSKEQEMTTVQDSGGGENEDDDDEEDNRVPEDPATERSDDHDVTESIDPKTSEEV